MTLAWQAWENYDLARAENDLGLENNDLGFGQTRKIMTLRQGHSFAQVKVIKKGQGLHPYPPCKFHKIL